MGILQMLDTSSSDTQALVLSPTRELAEQTQKVFNTQFLVCTVAFFHAVWTNPINNSRTHASWRSEPRRYAATGGFYCVW